MQTARNYYSIYQLSNFLRGRAEFRIATNFLQGYKKRAGRIYSANPVHTEKIKPKVRLFLRPPMESLREFHRSLLRIVSLAQARYPRTFADPENCRVRRRSERSTHRS
jgi:hypothetical protein